MLRCCCCCSTFFFFPSIAAAIPKLSSTATTSTRLATLTSIPQVVKKRVNLHSRDRKLSRARMEMHVENMTEPEAGAGDHTKDAHPNPNPKLLTLVIVQKGDQVLLGMKKRGFGVGYYNGFGGKVEPGETIHDAAARELHEESALLPLSMAKRGILTFHFDDNPQPWEVHVFHVGEYSGEPSESEEMAPRWFSVADIPYEQMWQDDLIWYPEFLKGRCFRGEFWFHNTHTLVSHSLHVVSKLDA